MGTVENFQLTAPGGKPVRHQRKVSQTETFAIGTLIQQKIVKRGEYADYVEGYSDLRIAAECGIEGIKAAHVAGLRKRLFGDFSPLVRTLTKDELTLRLVALERQVEELMEIVTGKKGD